MAFWGLFQVHVFSEMEDLNMLSQKVFAERGIDDLYPGASGNDRQSLLKVTCKHEGDASKERNIIDVLNNIFQKVFEGAIDSMTVLHRSFV